jgi:hypothetical protein
MDKDKKKKKKVFIDFDEMLKKELKNPEFKNHYDKYGKKLEAELRKKK